MQPEERQSLNSLVRGTRMPGARALHTSLPNPSGPGARRGLRWERRERTSSSSTRGEGNLSR
eukprot:4135565-Prorocentrum_lima.AAC.1